MFAATVKMPNSPDTPVRKSVRRLRWFKEAMHRQIDVMHAQYGIQYDVDDDEICLLFLRWLKSFEAQKPREDFNRNDYVNFTGGLMLRELVKSKPVTVKSLPAGADQSNPVYFWPEGYVYVALCLNIRAAVFEQEFDVEKHVSPMMDDLQTWWSFKENMNEDPNLATGFFDLFAGVEPSWTMPSIFSARKGQRNNDKIFVHRGNADRIKV